MQIMFEVCFLVGIGYSGLVLLGHIFGFLNFRIDPYANIYIYPSFSPFVFTKEIFIFLSISHPIKILNIKKKPFSRVYISQFAIIK